MGHVTNSPPMPLEWHPAYRGHTSLLDWLNGNQDAPPYGTIELPLPPAPLTLPKLANADPTEPLEMRTMRLTCHRAWGAAPYVGDPFVYVWHYATDELGRSIAGESTIVYR